MAGSAFPELVSRLVEAMGQKLDSVRRGPEGILLRTNDGFLFAFLENPDRVSLDVIGRLLLEVGDSPVKLVVLTPGRLPLALQAELFRHGATVVDAARFGELVRGLGLASYLGEEPRGEAPARPGRLLPSARQLDEIMGRARRWRDWGVPALALRFYRQAAQFKPEFLPAQDGIGRALLALGLTQDADRTFDHVLASQPEDVDARLGKAAVLGAAGQVAKEVEVYRAILATGPDRLDVRTHLVAALIAENDWTDARTEVEAVLTQSPEDAHFRFLHCATLLRTGDTGGADRERQRARDLGLTDEQERSLSQHLGLPEPDLPVRSRSTPQGRGGATRSSSPASAAPPHPAREGRVTSTKPAHRAARHPRARKAKKRPSG